MGNEEVRFRVATTADLDRIVEIDRTSFPSVRSTEHRLRSFTASRFGVLSDLVLAVRGDDILGQAFLFPLEAWFGGQAVQLGAIGSVSVALEARGQGVASALLRRLHVASDMRGDALTMLYAFRQGFYARLGYGPSASRRRLEIAPSAIPASWVLAARRVRRPRGEDEEGLTRAYADAAAKVSGWLTRSEAAWERRLALETSQFLVVDRTEGGVAGYIAFELVQEEPHGATTLRVEELVACDDGTRLALIGSLARMRDQVVAIEIELDASDPLELALVDPDARRFGTSTIEHDLGTIVGGPMVRVEDIPRAIEARGYAADGGFDVVVQSSGASDRDELAVSVQVANGRATVSAARGAGGAIRTTRATLASLFFGGLRPSDAVRMGLAEADARTAGRADTILAMPPPMPIDPF